MILEPVYTRLAINALTVSNYEKAARYFKKILKSSPKKTGANYNYALALIGLREFDKAAEHLERELEISGDHYNVLKAVAELKYNSGNREEARVWLARAAEKCPSKEEEKALRQKLKTAKDKALYEKFLKGYEFFEAGTALLHAGEWQAAKKMFMETVKTDKSNPYAYNNLGYIAMMEEKSYNEALDFFKKALKIADIPIIRKNLQKAEYYLSKQQK